MCGILGGVGARISDEQAQRAISSLHHRGPEGQGLWRSEHNAVLLGHTRLSIIDLPGGYQPMLNESGDLAAVVNGEFYGYEQATQHLTAKGHRFRTNCDSEILLHLYEDHGLKAVNCLRGEFAFILWDEKRVRLVAGRDRFGVKPLFYSLVKGGLWLASEAKALFAAGISAEWDEVAFYQHVFLIQDGNCSLFRGIHQLEPGHQLIFENGCLRVEQYWDLNYPTRGESEHEVAPNTEDWVGSFRERLNDAVRVRLRADTPVAYFLSGGIDSSAVLGVASQHWVTTGRAFTVRFDEPDYDEGDLAFRTASRFNADFTPISLSQDDLAGAYGDAIAQAETIGNLHGAARYLQCSAVHKAGYKVALTGDGADEVLAGYVHYAGDAGSTPANSLPAALQPLYAKLGHVPQWIRMLAVERSVFQLLLNRDYRARMRSCHPYLDCLNTLDYEGQLAGRDPLHQSLYLWNKLMLPNYVLAAERLEMAFAVETRPPFLDHLLFDVIRRIPPAKLVHQKQGKWPLRQFARGLLPESVLTQRKHPFAAPSALSRSSSALFRRLDDVFRGESLKEMPFFDIEAVRALWAALPSMSPQRRFSLEPALLIIFCAWTLQKRYVCQQ